MRFVIFKFFKLYVKGDKHERLKITTTGERVKLYFMEFKKPPTLKERGRIAESLIYFMGRKTLV